MDGSQGKITIGKLDAAKRQLETAIKLYFNNEDPISINTLTEAAYGIIHDINEKRGGKMMLKDMWKLLDPEAAKIFKSTVNAPANFLKHANRDPDASFDLDPMWTEILLWQASGCYCALTKEQPPLLLIFLLWFKLHRSPQDRNDPEVQEILKWEAEMKENGLPLPFDRHEFFQKLWPAPAATIPA